MFGVKLIATSDNKQSEQTIVDSNKNLLLWNQKKTTNDKKPDPYLETKLNANQLLPKLQMFSFVKLNRDYFIFDL